MPNALKGNAVK